MIKTTTKTEAFDVQHFSELNLPEKLQQSLDRIQFVTPTPIQAQAIPLALEGMDILGSAQTGTGKTGAFAIPLVARLMEDARACALVMTPTRELAAQVVDQIQQMIPIQNLKTALLIGGEPMPKQFKQLQMRPRIIVGTPGRINDHLMRQTLDLRYTKFLVLDETDRMLDMGFGIQIDKILAYMPKEDRQTLMFSATMPPSIVKMSAKYLRNPVRIAVGSTTSPAAKIKQEVHKIVDNQKYDRLLQQLEQRDGSIIVFVRTKHGADRMADKLSKLDHRVNALHGDLQQRKRDRVIQNFRDKKIRILVATDVAARGLDIPHIEHVINYDLPQVPEDYIHRIGRTARAGATGEAVNFVSPGEALKWQAIQRLLNDGESNEDSFRASTKRKPAIGKKPFGRKTFDKAPPKEKSFGEKPSRKKVHRYSEERFDNIFDDRPQKGQQEEQRPFGGFGRGRKPGNKSAVRHGPNGGAPGRNSEFRGDSRGPSRGKPAFGAARKSSGGGFKRRSDGTSSNWR